MRGGRADGRTGGISVVAFLAGLALVVALPGRLAAQSLPDLAIEARATLLRHDAPAFVGPGERLMLRLPGAEPSAPLSRRQAVALLAEFLEAAQEVDILVRVARELEPGLGYVELERRFRVAGTSEVQVQVVLLEFGRSATSGRWVLREVRVV
ncbi:MAG: hypothetical protein NW201_03230 [Gemmatimonadales bacterium]|nr:hypothetical protein [Gemmatimonadales bacterium]